MSTLVELTTKVKNRVGEDNTPYHFTDTMIYDWLNEAQRALCAKGTVSVSCGSCDSVANREYYILPPDYFKMVKVEVRRPSQNLFKTILPMNLQRRSPNRIVQANTVPDYYGIWGGNEVVTLNNKTTMYFDRNFAESNTEAPTDDIFIFYRQMPKTMTAGGSPQDPEVPEWVQDLMLPYAEMRVRARMAGSDRLHAQLYSQSKAEWNESLEIVKRYVHPLMIDMPLQRMDTAGNYQDWEDL